MIAASILLIACGHDEPPPAEEAPARSAPNELPVRPPKELKVAKGEPIGLRGWDVVLLTGGVEVHVDYLAGRMQPAGEYVDLQAPETFVVHIDAAQVRLPEQSLRAAMGKHGPDSPFRELSVRTDGDAFVIEGNARFLNLPFLFRGDPTVTPDGALALKIEKVRALGLGIKGFLAAFERPIENAVNDRKRVLDVERELLIVDPFPSVGPPRIRAAFTSAQVHDGALVARLGEAPPPDGSRSAFSLVGGILRSGGSILFDTTVSLVARDGGTLTIDPELLDEQIAGGFTKMTSGERRITLHLAPIAEVAGSAEEDPPVEAPP